LRVPEQVDRALMQGLIGFAEVDFEFWFLFEDVGKCFEHVCFSLMQIEVAARTLKVRAVTFSDKNVC
jgi:hypothetical protein